LLKHFEREVRETERKCAVLFWFGWMGRLLEVGRQGWEMLGGAVTGRLFGHTTSTTKRHYIYAKSPLGNTTYFVSNG